MAYIDLEKTEKTPKVFMDTDAREFSISGNSRPENVREFYMPILDKISQYFDAVFEKNETASFKDRPFQFNFKLGYFNSSTAKFISDMLVTIADYHKKGIEIKVYWYFDEGDDDMKEAGEDFSDMIDFKFNYVMTSR
jgi:hypothetical protein